MSKYKTNKDQMIVAKDTFVMSNNKERVSKILWLFFCLMDYKKNLQFEMNGPFLKISMLIITPSQIQYKRTYDNVSVRWQTVEQNRIEEVFERRRRQ